MNRKHRIPALSALAATALLPLAATAHNYSYVEGGYLSVDSGRKEDAGLRIGGAAALSPALALFGEYADLGDFEQLGVGLLFHTPVNREVDFLVGGSLENVDAGRDDDTGLGLRAGLRWQLEAGRFELNPELRYLDVFGSELTSLRVAGLMRVERHLDVQGALQGGDDDRVELGLRYNFGPRATGR